MEENVTLYRNILLCVDRSPSMQPVMMAVNGKLPAFFGAFPEDSSCWFASMTFDEDVSGISAWSGRPESGKEPEYEAAKAGKGCLAKALESALTALQDKLSTDKTMGRESIGALVLITDGVVDPDEEEKELRDALGELGKAEKDGRIFGYAVGFSPNAPETLADVFTDRTVVSLGDKESFGKQFAETAQKIMDAAVTGKKDDAGLSKYA